MTWIARPGVWVVLAASLVSGCGQPDESSSAPAAARAPDPAPAAVSAPAAPRAPVVRAAERSPRIELRGVLLQRQGGRDHSQALLSVDGQRAQAFHQGEAVVDGWTLQGIEADHVVLANSAGHYKLGIVQAAAAPNPASTAAAAAAPSDVILPGFVAAGPRSATPPPPPSVETNRRFVRDLQTRAAGARP